MCAMSTISRASTSWAIWPRRSKSMMRGYALAPATIIRGRTSRACSVECVVVDACVFLAHAVGVDLEPLAAEVDGRAVSQVAAMGEVHAQHAITDVEHGHVSGHVGLRAGMGLDVDVLRAREERKRALLGESLGVVDELAAAVVALAGQALGVLVGQPRALRLEYGREGVVLAGDQLDLPALAVALADHRRPQLRVDLGDGGPGAVGRAEDKGHGRGQFSRSATAPP